MIDVKTLRIGSHISVGGVRKRIDHIGINGELGEIYIFNPEWTKERQSKERSEHTWFCTQIEPIPLTAGLLTEIGFVKRTRYDNDKDYYIDAASARQIERKRLIIPQIEIQNYSEIGNPELWEIKILSTDNDFAVEHKITVRYLHELESFVYLTIGKELIE